MVEVLPTPLRPSSAVMPVAGTVKVTSSTTCWPAMRARRPRTSRIASAAMSAVLMRVPPEVGALDGRVGHDGSGCVDGEQAAVVHDGDPVHEAEHDLHVVLDHHHGAARSRCMPRMISMSAGDVAGADAGHRLVQQQMLGIRRQQHGDLDLALVAVGEVAGGGVELVAEPDLVELVHAPAGGGIRRPGESGRARARRRARPGRPAGRSPARSAAGTGWRSGTCGPGRPWPGGGRTPG